MKVYLAAKTEFVNPRPDLIKFDKKGSAELAEFAGRGCYKSWDRPNPATATNEGYLNHIMEVGHFSVIEHGSASIWIEDVPRSLTHELVRHRLFSYSEMSQRYVRMSDTKLIDPPDVRDMVDKHMGQLIMDQIKRTSKNNYNLMEEMLEEIGLKGKRKRQAARAAMPESAATNIMMTGNHRSWRKFLLKRGSVHADIAIRELAVEITRLLKSHFPAIYQDVSIQRLTTGETVVNINYLDA